MKLSIVHNYNLRQYEIYEEGKARPLILVPYLGAHACRSNEQAAQVASSCAAYPALVACLSRVVNCPDMCMEEMEDESVEAQEEAFTLLRELGHE